VLVSPFAAMIGVWRSQLRVSEGLWGKENMEMEVQLLGHSI
jgi:hypothetical protein